MPENCAKNDEAYYILLMPIWVDNEAIFCYTITLSLFKMRTCIVASNSKAI